MWRSALALLVVVLVVASTTARGDDQFTWRSSRPLLVPVERQNVKRVPDEVRSLVRNVEYPHAVQELQTQIALADAEVRSWDRQLREYRRLRYLDAFVPIIESASLSRLAAERRREDLTADLRRLRRYRPDLLSLTTQ